MKNESLAYQICSRCIMDTSDRSIVFDENGVCNHCKKYDKVVKTNLLNPSERKTRLESIIKKIKTSSKKRKYDCMIGLSGGADSSYVAHIAHQYKLRALLVHFDNGWDSELAIKNIENIVNKTGFEYYNYIVDWEEFKDLQRSYLQASVVDIEVPTDMGIFSLLPIIAMKNKIKYHLFGQNIETECTMGKDWNYPKKMDRSNLEGIHNAFGLVPLKTFPNFSPLKQYFYNNFFKVEKINILQYDECNYDKIKKVLSSEYGWRDYSVKHGESIFTKFYQSYILPKKFGFDKRRAHLSDRINAGHISRDWALSEIKKSPYISPKEVKNEYDYFINKIGYSSDEFNQIMLQPPKSHYDYPNSQEYGNIFEKTLKRLRDVVLIRNKA